MINFRTSLTQLLFPFLSITISLLACNDHSKLKPSGTKAADHIDVKQQETNDTLVDPNVINVIDDNIRSMYQDTKGNYWFGTNGDGVYRYSTWVKLSKTTSVKYDKSGKTLQHFTTKEGLSNNQVLSIQEDASGNIYFGTGLFGVSRFDGTTFSTLTSKENVQAKSKALKDSKIKPDDMWFYAGGGVFRGNKNSLTYIPLDNSKNQGSPFTLSRYAIYSILKDKKGNLWFGSQAQGVCRLDVSASSKSEKYITWFTEKGLAGPAVLALFEDSVGNIWFGNNGGGLFKYDGKTLINFTEVKGLSNREFRTSGKSKPGTLARIYAINEDNNGDMWIGTVDSGVWRYDGNYLTNYTTKDGLSSNAVNTIYKDNNGELWFGTDSNGVCKFNGNAFTKFIP